MRHWFVSGALFLALLAPAAQAQAPDPTGNMPPGHPSVGANDLPSDDDEGTDDTPEAPPQQLPPGHPQVAPGSSPKAGMGPQLPPDSSMPDPAIPRGSVEANIVDDKGKPLGGVSVRLGIVRQSVAEGETKDFRTSITNGEGKVRFDDLAYGSKYSYRISVRSDPADYASETFSLREDVGQRLTMHIYPVTSDIRRATMGISTVIVIEPKDEVFQFEVLFLVFNIGAVTWVPNDLVIDLPRGAKAFNAQESMEDTRAVAEGEGRVKLLGSYTPGQHDVVFRFQVPNDHDESVDFRMGLPPHAAEVRVMSEAGRNMGLEVTGFPASEPSVGQDGKRMLIAARRLSRGETELPDVSIRLTGIPTPGPGRWAAVGLAALLAAAGVSLNLRDKDDPKSNKLPVKDVARARNLLLDELVALEKARRAEDIGPRTYESARRALLDALTRLEAQLPDKPKKPAKRRPTPRPREA